MDVAVSVDMDVNVDIHIHVDTAVSPTGHVLWKTVVRYSGPLLYNVDRLQDPAQIPKSAAGQVSYYIT
jgi:hypothetical protein